MPDANCVNLPLILILYFFKVGNVYLGRHRSAIIIDFPYSSINETTEKYNFIGSIFHKHAIVYFGAFGLSTEMNLCSIQLFREFLFKL